MKNIRKSCSILSRLILLATVFVSACNRQVEKPDAEPEKAQATRPIPGGESPATVPDEKTRPDDVGAEESAEAAQAIAERLVHEPFVDESTRLEAQMSILRAAAYLLDTQQDDGSWSGHPGITAMCLVSLSGSAPTGINPEALNSATEKGLGYIRSRIEKDGSVRRNKAEEDVYSASVCLMALQTLGRHEDQERIGAIRKYLIQSQIRAHSDFGYGGGLGYGAYPDLSNTHWALEAIRLTRPDEPGPETHALWKQAVSFVSKCQVTEQRDPEFFGGFLYYPPGKEPKQPAHEKTRVVWGSLTMGAVKCLLFGGVVEDDPRIQNGLIWLGNNYNLTGNPGLDQGGLYYYYYMFSSAMVFLGRDHIEDAGGTRHNWRQELVEILLSRQRGEGEWHNVNPLWLEGNPALCTAYAIKAMVFALRR